MKTFRRMFKIISAFFSTCISIDMVVCGWSEKCLWSSKHMGFTGTGSPRAHLHVVGMLRLNVFDINQPSLPTPFYSVLECVSVFMDLSSVFHSIIFFRQLSAFSLCSSGSIPALSVLLTTYLYESLPQPWYNNPLWLTGLKAPTNYCLCMLTAHFILTDTQDCLLQGKYAHVYIHADPWNVKCKVIGGCR